MTGFLIYCGKTGSFKKKSVFFKLGCLPLSSYNTEMVKTLSRWGIRWEPKSLVWKDWPCASDPLAEAALDCSKAKNLILRK